MTRIAAEASAIAVAVMLIACALATNQGWLDRHFLPSFLFIFLGAPYIERLRRNRMLTGALSGVTAAVVGVILNLALVFGAAVIFPNGLGGEIEWFAIVLTLIAFVALTRLKIDVLWVILTAGFAGLLKALLFSNLFPTS